MALEEELGTALALVGLEVLTGGIGDVAVVAADVGTEVATETATEAGTEATTSAAVTGEITNEAGDIVVGTMYQDMITDSFIEEVTGTGEGGAFFGEGIEVITNVDDVDSILEARGPRSTPSSTARWRSTSGWPSRSRSSGSTPSRSR